MSAKHMGECFELDLSEYATGEVSVQALKWTLMALADHAHIDGGSARPSAKTIAWKTDLGLRTVNRALKRLEEIGAIEAVGERGTKTGQPVEWMLRFDRLPRKGQVGIPSETDGLPVSGAGGMPVILAHESSLTVEEKETTSPSPAEVVQLRPRNEVWDALTEIFGKPGTRQKEIARGKVVGELRAAGVERAEQVHRLADEYRRTFSDEVALTQHALGKHADQLAHAIRGRQAKRAVSAPCEFCGVGAGMHDADCVRPQAASA